MENNDIKVTCGCGSVIKKNFIRQHEKTLKHKLFVDRKKIISERKKIKVTRECGSICRKSDRGAHERTLKHTSFMNNKETTI